MSTAKILNSGGSVGILLVISFLLMLAGALMFTTRRGMDLIEVISTTRFTIERGFIMGAAVLTAVGFLMMEEYMGESPGRSLVKIGATAYLIGATLIVAREAIHLSEGEINYPLVVVYVVLAFASQAVIGVGIVLSTSLPATIGWLTLVWNFAWLIILPLVTPADIYFPVLHHLMPLVIGISLLGKS